jgi:hypothetical protein
VQSMSPTAPKIVRRASVGWWQIDLTGKTVQQGFLDDPGGKYSYMYPSIAVNKNNDMLIGYTRCSPDTFPSACYAYRRGTDPLEQLKGDFVYKAGEVAFGVASTPPAKYRWGDYSSSCADPLTDDLWTLQMCSVRDATFGYTVGLHWKRLK